MQLHLAKLKQEYSAARELLVVREVSGDHLVVMSPDDLSVDQPYIETVNTNTVDLLPLSLSSYREGKEYRVDGSGADEDPNVEIYLIYSKEGHDMYHIVRRCKGRDTVLTDNALSLGQSCNILAVCNEIGWECLFENTGDVETVCLSNAVAIMESLDEG